MRGSKSLGSVSSGYWPYSPAPLGDQVRKEYLGSTPQGGKAITDD